MLRHDVPLNTKQYSLKCVNVAEKFAAIVEVFKCIRAEENIAAVIYVNVRLFLLSEIQASSIFFLRRIQI